MQILACFMWIAVQTGSPFGSLGSLRSLASVHVESTCEISSILSLVPDSPNHATCLPDRARRLPDMSPIRHQASLGNSMYICIYIYIWRFLFGIFYFTTIKIIMCICIYVYMYIYMYICIYMYIFINLYICLYVYVYMYIYVYIHIYTSIHIT